MGGKRREIGGKVFAIPVHPMSFQKAKRSHHGVGGW